MANGANVKYHNKDLTARYLNPEKVKELTE